MITLNKKNENGKIQCWMAKVEGNKAIFEWGQEGGKIQKKVQTFTKGKNIGKKNETTPEQQALFEMVIKARKKVESGYSVIKGKELIKSQTSDTVVKTNIEIPKPMLANKYQEHVKKFNDRNFLYAQPKLDGNRALVNVQTGKIYSRSRKEIISVPHISKEICDRFIDSGVEWLDGELYSHDLTFNEMQSIIRKTKNIDFEKSKSISFNIFDFISNLPFEARLEKLEDRFQQIIENGEPEFFNLVETIEISVNDIQKRHDKFVSQGYEGIMLRFPEFSYEEKRSLGLFKYKNFFDEEYEIVGFNAQEKNSNVLGTIIVADENGITFPATPAMTVKEKEDIWNNQEEFLGQMATVRYQEKFEDTGIPRFGVIKGLRLKMDM